MIVIVDYGLGNLRSVLRKLPRDRDTLVSSRPEDVARASGLVLPGVGSFATGMTNLDRYGLIPVLTQKVLTERVPILGICLGMQLFCRGSEEGEVEGLGWIAADTQRFRFAAESLPIPHVGWNEVEMKKEHPLLAALPPSPRFYFAHSYHVSCDDPEDIVATARYGYEFSAVIARGNISGTQFHPEKSHRPGLQVLDNFTRNLCSC